MSHLCTHKTQISHSAYSSEHKRVPLDLCHLSILSDKYVSSTFQYQISDDLRPRVLQWHQRNLWQTNSHLLDWISHPWQQLCAHAFYSCLLCTCHLWRIHDHAYHPYQLDRLNYLLLSLKFFENLYCSWENELGDLLGARFCENNSYFSSFH